MGLREQTESYFGMKVRAERERRGWSQDELANRLTEKGVPVHGSTIAKIESERKPRAVRLAEASAIADVFEVSLDRFLGRGIGPRQDAAFTLRALYDTVELASAQIHSIQVALRERSVELELFAFPERDSIVYRCGLAADALAHAGSAFTNVLRLPESEGVARESRLDLLLEKLLDAMPIEEDDQ